VSAGRRAAKAFFTSLIEVVPSTEPAGETRTIEGISFVLKKASQRGVPGYRNQ
jgi:hypothetical protein